MKLLRWLLPAPKSEHDLSGLTWRQAEKKLRSAGLSRSAAKRYVHQFRQHAGRAYGD
jgi:hypothetical protein